MTTLEASELMMFLQTAEGLRDRAMLTLTMDNGTRAGEVRSLLKHNIRQEMVVVYSKIGWRKMPISDETRDLFLEVQAPMSVCFMATRELRLSGSVSTGLSSCTLRRLALPV
jgi:integrase